MSLEVIKMEKVTPRTLSGFMELLPADQLKMERLLGTLRRVYSLYGFTPLDTCLLYTSLPPSCPG